MLLFIHFLHCIQDFCADQSSTFWNTHNDCVHNIIKVISQEGVEKPVPSHKQRNRATSSKPLCGIMESQKLELEGTHEDHCAQLHMMCLLGIMHSHFTELQTTPFHTFVLNLLIQPGLKGLSLYSFYFIYSMIFFK